MLRLSSFLNLSFEHRKIIDDDQYSFGYNFFYYLANLDIEKPYNNNLFNGVRDLTIEIKNFLLSTDDGKRKCSSFVISWLIPSINSLTIDDYYSKISTLINNDETIAPKTKNGLLKPFNEEKYDQFICKTLMYAISKDNIVIKDKIDAYDIEFVLEGNKKCAYCGESILVRKNKKPAYKYGIVNIFPEGLNEEKKLDFISITGKEPNDYSHSSNKICCCSACADDYECQPTTDIFLKLLDKKRMYINKANSDSALVNAKLDEEIQIVLSKVRNINDFSMLADFRIKPLKIKEKIYNNEPLRQSINTDVNSYYHFIRNELSQLDDSGVEFKVIGSQFQLCYQKLTKTMDDQEEIYNRIIKWVLDELSLTDKYRTAARIVVSFFVQNCEVFDEIAK